MREFRLVSFKFCLYACGNGAVNIYITGLHSFFLFSFNLGIKLKPVARVTAI